MQHVHMQQQAGGNDCGLFAIATATAICNGVDPATQQFSQGGMRQHLLQSFSKGMLLPFPSLSVPKRKPEVVFTERIHVYCTCRQPDDGPEDGAV